MKTIFPMYRNFHVKDKTVARPSCLVHPGVRDKRRVSEIDLSQPRHETAFWWRYNGPVTSQSTDPIKWPNHPLELIGTYVHVNTHNKEYQTQRCRRSTNIQVCLIFCTYPYVLSLNGWHSLFCIANNRHGVTITTHAIKCHFLIWMTTARQPTKHRRSCVIPLKCTFICVYWWTRQRIHNTLIVVDRYLRLMGNKTIANSVESRLESFYPPFVAGIDLPHQGVVDSYNLYQGDPYTGKTTSLYWYPPTAHRPPPPPPPPPATLQWIGKDNCKTRRETVKFGDMVCRILNVFDGIWMLFHHGFHILVEQRYVRKAKVTM